MVLGRIFQTAFATASKVRGARIFHADGVNLAGTWQGAGEFSALLGAGQRPVAARLSKAVGTPRGWPDVLGLAFRVQDRHNQPWDFALASTGSSQLTRLALDIPAGWSSATYGSLMPYRLAASGPVLWISAYPVRGLPADRSLRSLAEHTRTHTMGFELRGHKINGESHDLGTVALTAAEANRQGVPHYYDPMRHHPADVTLRPAFVSYVRELAYRGSSTGRGQGR